MPEIVHFRYTKAHLRHFTPLAASLVHFTMRLNSRCNRKPKCACVKKINRLLSGHSASNETIYLMEAVVMRSRHNFISAAHFAFDRPIKPGIDCMPSGTLAVDNFIVSLINTNESCRCRRLRPDRRKGTKCRTCSSIAADR